MPLLTFILLADLALAIMLAVVIRMYYRFKRNEAQTMPVAQNRQEDNSPFQILTDPAILDWKLDRDYIKTLPAILMNDEKK